MRACACVCVCVCVACLCVCLCVLVRVHVLARANVRVPVFYDDNPRDGHQPCSKKISRSIYKTSVYKKSVGI